jgi:hypothetical protein
MSESLEIATDDIVVIFGKRRSGKTVFLRHLAKHLKRYIIWDINWEHGNLGYVVHHHHFIMPEFNRGMKHLIFQPLDKSEESFNKFCLIVFSLSNLTVIIEEIERYATVHFMPEGLKRIIDIGRHRGIGLYCTCRRAKRIHGDINFNADHIIVFAQHRPQDKYYLREWIGEKAMQIDNLAPFHFLHYDNDYGKTVERKAVPLE